MDKDITLIEVLQLFKKRLKIIVGASLIGLLFMIVYSFMLAVPQYSSTTQLLVNRSQLGEDIRESDIYTNLQLINTYRDIIQSPIVLDEVQNNLDLNMGYTELSERIEISTTDTSQVFSIHVRADSPNQAASIANNIAETFRIKINEIMNVQNVTIISQGIPNTDPVSPNIMLNLTLGFMLGLFAGLGLSFLLELMDNTIKSDQYISDQLGWSNLGQINEVTLREMKQFKQPSGIEQGTYPPRVKSRI